MWAFGSFEGLYSIGTNSSLKASAVGFFLKQATMHRIGIAINKIAINSANTKNLSLTNPSRTTKAIVTP
jgi:hypothetical protein